MTEDDVIKHYKITSDIGATWDEWLPEKDVEWYRKIGWIVEEIKDERKE